MHLCSLVPHTHTSSLYFHSISLDHLTSRQLPLTINLTLAPTLPFAYFSFIGCLFTCIALVLSNLFQTISPPSPSIHLYYHNNLLSHISVILHFKQYSLLIFRSHSKFTSSHRPNFSHTSMLLLSTHTSMLVWMYPFIL